MKQHNISALHPLLVDDTTGEPYLRLPHPNENIIITPPRMEDAPFMVPIMNNPRVYMNLTGPPFPFTLQHAEERLASRVVESRQILEDLQKVEEGTPSGPTGLKLCDGCPIRSIREVMEDGQQVYIGEIIAGRCKYFHVVDAEEKERLIANNNAKTPGDPDIVFGMSDLLAPSHHGRGIMTIATRTLMEQWMIPRMGAHMILVSTVKGNIASVRVFEKVGFALTGVVDDCKKHQERKGGQIFGLNILEWHADQQGG